MPSFRFFLFLFLTVLSSGAIAAGDAESSWTAPNTLNTLLLIVVILFLVVIGFLTRIFLTTLRLFQEHKNKGLLPMLVAFAFLSAVFPLHAQDVLPVAAPASAPSPYNFETWILVLVLVTEFFAIVILTYWINRFLKLQEAPQPAAEKATAPKPGWWDKMNAFKPIEAEGELDTGHDYDGIRELNNITPPWFVTAFVASIIFAMLYLWRYHVAESAPLMVEEFEIEMREASIAQEAFLKKQANNVDEQSVVLLGSADIETGKTLFKAQCAACHLENGGGSVGPNLTDNFAIHGGDMKSLFKTIKYGWPEKGMKSWKDDFSPNQIAQLASYVHSLQGTNVSGGKEAQGDAIAQTAASAVDSAASTGSNMR